MKTDIFTLATSKSSLKAISIAFLSLSLLNACQKTPEPETVNETAAEATTQTTPVALILMHRKLLMKILLSLISTQNKIQA